MAFIRTTQRDRGRNKKTILTIITYRPQGKGEIIMPKCQKCNPYGVNRTGMVMVGFVGASTTMGYGVRCPNNCDDGYIDPEIVSEYEDYAQCHPWNQDK